MPVGSPLRAITVVLGMASVLALASLRLAAQEPAPPKPEAPPKPTAETKTYDPSRRVPPFFGQIGLSPDQKEEIYKIRARHQERINALEKQLAQVRSELLAECEAKLTEAQRQALENRRKAAAESGRAKASKKTPLKPAT